MRPHPPPPLCQTKPRPPSSTPPTKSSASVKRINSSSLSRIHGQNRVMPASTGLKTTQTLMCKRVACSGGANSHVSALFSELGSDQNRVKTTHHCSHSPETQGAALHCRTPTHNRSFHRISTANPPSHRSIHKPGTRCDLSPQRRERSSNNTDTCDSLTSALSPQCEADSYGSASDEHAVTTAGKPKTHNSATVPVDVV